MPERLSTGRALALFVLVGLPLSVIAYYWLLGPEAELELEIPTAKTPSRPSPISRYTSLDDLTTLFDREGKPVVWYSGDPEGEIVFFDGEVTVDPLTGAPAAPISPDVVSRVRAAVASQSAEQVQMERERASRAAAQRRKEAETAFVERIVSRSALHRVRNSKRLVLIAVQEQVALEGRMADALGKKGFNPDTSVLKDGVFDASVFDPLRRGDIQLLERLGLRGIAGHIFLGQLELGALGDAPIGGGVKNIDGTLRIVAIPLSGNSPIVLPPLIESGAGFDRSRALAALEERLVEAMLERPEIARL